MDGLTNCLIFQIGRAVVALCLGTATGWETKLFVQPCNEPEGESLGAKDPFRF
jgi:hypothetical protein